MQHVVHSRRPEDGARQKRSRVLPLHRLCGGMSFFHLLLRHTVVSQVLRANFSPPVLDVVHRLVWECAVSFHLALSCILLMAVQCGECFVVAACQVARDILPNTM